MPYPATKKARRVARRVAGVSADGMDRLKSSIFCHYHGHSDIAQLPESRGLQVVLDDVGLHTGDRADPVRRAGFELLRGDQRCALAPCLEERSLEGSIATIKRADPGSHADRTDAHEASVDVHLGNSGASSSIDAASHHRMHQAPDENHLQV